MTKTFIKKYWLILTSAGCISTGIALACSGDWGSEYGTSNFTPELFVDSAYSPFFYSEQFYYGINHDESHITRFSNSNIDEWSAYLGASIPAAQLSYYLNDAKASAIDSAITRPAKDKKTTAFFQYLRLAKKSEAFALAPITFEYDRDDKKPKKQFDATKLNSQLKEQLAAKTADPFLQERYWFQLLRSQFFNGNPGDVIKTYTDYSSKFPSNKLHFRSLAYTAGAYYKLKQYSKANYYYSQVYDSCDDLKTVAHYSFHPQDETDWRGTLALCRSTKEKATLWQMLGIFYSDPQRAITQIYQLDPKSDKLALLLSRAINQSEQRFGSDRRDTPNPSTDSSNQSLRPLVTRIADAGNTTQPWVWQQAAGYLCMLDQKYADANKHYDKAAALLPKDPLPRSQLRLLKLLNTISATHLMDAKMEQKILPDLEWLLDLKGPDAAFRYGTALSWLRETIANNYKLNGDKVRSECFRSRSDFYRDNSNVEALKVFLGKANKTPYEQLCARISDKSRQDLFEYQAIQLCMNDKFDEAITAMKQADSAGKLILPGNPFNARINDCHDCDHEAAQKIKYSKLDLVQKLKEMKSKVDAGQDTYTNAILIGNAQYNITYYGNDRAFYECKIVGTDGWYSIDSIFFIQLTGMNTAAKYYALALKAATNDEQRAKAQYLLAKCQRNQWYNQTSDIRNPWAEKKESQPDFIAWDGFKALKQYSNTKYYNEVLKECGYFRTYTEKNH